MSNRCFYDFIEKLVCSADDICLVCCGVACRCVYLFLPFAAYYREFMKVVEAADVILEVLDARDPMGTRCKEVEDAVLNAAGRKRLVMVLNKVTLYT